VEGIDAARLGKFVARLAGNGRMIQIAPQIRILVAVEAVDGRKGIDAIAQLCREKLNADPFSGYLFIFRTRRGTAIRVLQYDGQGFWLATKRLSKGRFRWWPTGTEPSQTLRAHQAQLLLAAGNPDAEAPPAWRPCIPEEISESTKNTCVPFSTLPH
jgi:transposase